MWKKQHKAILNLIVEKCDPRILIHANLEPVLVLHSLLESQPLRTVLAYYKNAKLSLPKSYTHYNREILQLENKLMYFAYLYIEYADLHSLKPKAKFWDNCFNFLKSMSDSTHTQTQLWILEVLDLLFKKISLKEIGFDARSRHELH